MSDKISLVIASALKPVDDTRMYEKFAYSLAATGRYAVNIIGFLPRKEVTDKEIRFYPLFDFHRLSGKRLLANFKGYQALQSIQPQIIIVTTPELYPAVALFRRQHSGCVVLYDVQENYDRNIHYNQGFGWPWKNVLRWAVRQLEKRLIKRAKRYLLAERGYVLEMPQLPPERTVIIQNKVILFQPKSDKDVNHPLSIIYTGTISEIYGIRQAMHLVQTLVEKCHPDTTFTVVGHVPQHRLHRDLLAWEQQYPWLQLVIDEKPLPHSIILSYISQADWGIVSHQPVPSITNCFPTRIWEYMAYQLPFLLQDHPYWTDYCAPWQCAVALDFNNFSVEHVYEQMRQGPFYPHGVPEDIYWKQEESKLLDAVASGIIAK